MSAGRLWTKVEDMFILDRPDLTAREVGEILERSVAAIDTRRQVINDGSVNFRKGELHPWRFNPRSISSRTLIAKTCTECGELLSSKMFRRTKGGWLSACVRCKGRREARRLRLGDNARHRKLQEISLRFATRNNQPLLEEDYVACSDNSRSNLEIALSIGRTYNSVSNIRVSAGLSTKRDTEQRDEKWVVMLDPEIEEMVARLRKELADG